MSFGSRVIGEEAAAAQVKAATVGSNVFGWRVTGEVAPTPPTATVVAVPPPPFDLASVIPEPPEAESAPVAVAVPEVQVDTVLWTLNQTALKEHIAAHPEDVDAVIAVEMKRSGKVRGTIARALIAAELSAHGQQRADIVASLERMLP